jgi:hypothetical protein
VDWVPVFVMCLVLEPVRHCRTGSDFHCILPEFGTRIPKHFGEAHLMFVLTKNVHLVCIINGIR